MATRFGIQNGHLLMHHVFLILQTNSLPTQISELLKNPSLHWQRKLPGTFMQTVSSCIHGFDDRSHSFTSKLQFVPIQPDSHSQPVKNNYRNWTLNDEFPSRKVRREENDAMI